MYRLKLQQLQEKKDKGAHEFEQEIHETSAKNQRNC